jgi:peptide/nickel transport system ATP-binding protein
LGEDALLKYPHEFSGGERQRICIARAIAADPQLLICDEAVSALDLSIRSQILELINELKRKLGLSILFITHDLGVVKCIASSIIVMKNGRIVERGECNEVLASPTEEYTRRLIAAVPRVIG